MAQRGDSSSVTQSCQHCDSLLDPMPILMLLLHWQPNVQHEICRMTRGRQSTCSPGCLVNWANIGMTIVNISLLLRFNPNGLHRSKKDFGHRLLKCLLLFVPPTSFNKQAINIHSITRPFRQIIFALIRNNLKIEINGINGNDILPGKVLLSTRQEWLSEIEAWNPEHWRRSIINPILNELKTFQEIFNPRSKWLERGVCSLVPYIWNCIVE